MVLQVSKSCKSCQNVPQDAIKFLVLQDATGCCKLLQSATRSLILSQRDQKDNYCFSKAKTYIFIFNKNSRTLW